MGQRRHREFDEAEVGEAAVELDLQAACGVGHLAEDVQVELHLAGVVGGVRGAAHAEQPLALEVGREDGEVAAAGRHDVDDHAAVFAAVDFRERERAARVVHPDVEGHDVLGVREAQRPRGVDVEVVDGAVDVARRRRRDGRGGGVGEAVAADAGGRVDVALVDAHPVHPELPRQRAGRRGARQVAAHGEVQQQVERAVEGRGVAAGHVGIRRGVLVVVPVGGAADGPEVRAVDEPANLLLVPFHGVDVEAVRRVDVLVLLVVEGVERPGHAPVQRRLGEGFRVAREHLRDVDLAARGPRAVVGGRRQHPEGRPQAPAGGGLDAGLDAPVGDVELAVRGDPRRRVLAAVGGGLAARGDDQVAAGDGDVVRLVALQFVVAPAGNALRGAVARLDVPLGGVEAAAFELVRPDEFPALRGEDSGRHVAAALRRVGVVAAATGEDAGRQQDHAQSRVRVANEVGGEWTCHGLDLKRTRLSDRMPRPATCQPTPGARRNSGE